ncbi:hypothetical protein ACQPW3_26380 [Actinosynnema sp. CA-248983]
MLVGGPVDDVGDRVGFSPVGRTLATLDDTGLLRLWNLDPEGPTREPREFVHDNPTPDGGRSC